MTRALPRPCTFRDATGPCPEYATNRGRCDDHPRKAWAHTRTRQQRGYDAQHDRDRERQLRLHPFCQWPACTAPATQMDHVIPLAENGARHDPANHQSLCDEHHETKTRAEALRARRRMSGS